MPIWIERLTQTLGVGNKPKIIAHAGEWVCYSSPEEDAQYIAVCLAGFSPQTIDHDGDWSKQTLVSQKEI